jgi:hypothetical protein
MLFHEPYSPLGFTLCLIVLLTRRITSTNLFVPSSCCTN